VKAWKKNDAGALEATVLWKKDFGGKFSRMRDAEVADVYGDGKQSIAVATHDQGVVAVLRADRRGLHGGRARSPAEHLRARDRGR
jgi:hypothetical protein